MWKNAICLDETNSLAHVQNAMFDRKLTLHITLNIPKTPWNMVVTVADVFPEQGQWDWSELTGRFAISQWVDTWFLFWWRHCLALPLHYFSADVVFFNHFHLVLGMLYVWFSLMSGSYGGSILCDASMGGREDRELVSRWSSLKAWGRWQSLTTCWFGSRADEDFTIISPTLICSTWNSAMLLPQVLIKVHFFCLWIAYHCAEGYYIQVERTNGF